MTTEKGLRIIAPLVLVRSLIAGFLACLFGCLSLGCEDVSHDNIDKWMRTEKGPGKLVSAFEDTGIGADLSAHAGRNLVRMDKIEDVMEGLGDMSPERRAEVLPPMIERLWSDALIEGEMTAPSPEQSMAKDALFDIRGFTSGDTRDKIDGYLADWLTEGYYSARARSGRVRGVTIVRTIGDRAAVGLLRRTKSLLTAQAGDGNKRFQLEDPLLQALAASGHPDGVGLLLDLTAIEHPDESLKERAMNALYIGYVKNDGLFEVAEPQGLVPHVGRLADLVLSGDADNRAINDAIRLIGRAGAPACIAPLVRIMARVGDESDATQLLWVSANEALQCGKVAALIPVAEALPTNQDYSEEELSGAIVNPLLALEEDGEDVARKARTLLQSKSWVARLVGVEILGALALEKSAREDAELLRGLAKDRVRLRGWWGDQSALPRRERKPEPRLGERALEIADKLDPRAKSG